MDNPKAIVRKTRKYGKAVFANQAIGKGELIAAFDGPIFDDHFGPWTEDLYNHAIQFGETFWRDSKGIARLLNHSCEPNCGIKGFFNIVAMRRIEAGEELTWDYEMTEKNAHWRLQCQCQSKQCRKVIGNYSNMPKKVRARYKGYISHWLVKTNRPRKMSEASAQK